MEQHFFDLDTILAQRLEQLSGKMQACCWRCCGTVHFCINGLVTVLILELLVDIRWQRHGAEFFEDLFKNAVEVKRHLAPGAGIGDDFAFEPTLAEIDDGADFGALARMNENLPGIRKIVVTL